MRGSDYKQAQQIILGLIRQAGGSLSSRTRLYKAFYIAHLYYFQNSPGLLSTWPVVRMPYGPGIESGDMLLEGLAAAGKIKISEQQNGPYVEECFTLVDPVQISLDEAASSAIAKAWAFVKDRTATELSDITHHFSRSWIRKRNGEPLNIYIDTLSEEAYQQDRRAISRIKDGLALAFGA